MAQTRPGPEPQQGHIPSRPPQPLCHWMLSATAPAPARSGHWTPLLAPLAMLPLKTGCCCLCCNPWKEFFTLPASLHHQLLTQKPEQMHLTAPAESSVRALAARGNWKSRGRQALLTNNTLKMESFPSGGIRGFRSWAANQPHMSVVGSLQGPFRAGNPCVHQQNGNWYSYHLSPLPVNTAPYKSHNIITLPQTLCSYYKSFFPGTLETYVACPCITC